ncbi:MAG: imidazole glycerol phosphate synthase subunit HisF [Polyangiaceae bacterium]|nr:imidazole glycerol phosphate synthase subunit HisF [Polyangiaceae bacterium]
MLATRVIPCLDVRDGRIVKGVRFQGLRDAGDPAERAATYEAEGADEIVLLDVSATPEGRAHGLDTVRAVRRVLGIPLTVGGGVRSHKDALALLEAGADKVAVNTAAVERAELLEEIAFRFGNQCTVLALDARAREGGPPRAPGGPPPVSSWEVLVRSGHEPTGTDAVAWAEEAVRRGAGEIVLTSWDRDGTRSGYDTALIRAVSSAVRVPVVASGGAASAEHLIEAARAGASAVLAASLFHDGDTTVAEVKRVLAAAGLTVRPAA